MNLFWIAILYLIKAFSLDKRFPILHIHNSLNFKKKINAIILKTDPKYNEYCTYTTLLTPLQFLTRNIMKKKKL